MVEVVSSQVVLLGTFYGVGPVDNRPSTRLEVQEQAVRFTVKVMEEKMEEK